MRTILLAVFLSPIFASAAGTTFTIRSGGLAKAKTLSQKIADAFVYAWAVTGGGYSPTTGNVVIEFNNGWPSYTDKVVVPVAPVSPDAEPSYGDPSTNMFGHAGSPTSGSYSQEAVKNFHSTNPNANTCSGLASPVTKTGTCVGGVISCKSEVRYMRDMVSGFPWWHPNCSCVGYPTVWPYTETPCTPYGDGEDRYDETVRCYCVSPFETSTSNPYPDLPGPNPSGAFQPTTIDSADQTFTDNMRTTLSTAKTWLEANAPAAQLADVTTALGKSYAAISDGSIALNTPMILAPGDYDYPPGSPAASAGACSTCAAVSPSTASLQNVWINNGQLHVWQDNPATSTVTVNGTVALADGTLPTVVEASTFTRTLTLSGVYDQWVLDRGTIAIQGLMSNLVLPSISSTTLQTEYCVDLVHLGHHCVDVAYWHLDYFIAMVRFLVIGGAYVSAFFMVWG